MTEPMLTLRPTNTALEAAFMQRKLSVLDHGFIRLVDYMGGDDAVVQAARVSYGAGTKTVREDRGLIRYMMSHGHTSPFEMAEIKLHVKMPIFVARQWIRQRTANVNEASARYSIMDKEFYTPDVAAMRAQSKTNKQGGGAVIDAHRAEHVQNLLRQSALDCYGQYEANIAQHDLARELARIGLTLSMYTQMYWKIDVHNLLNFLSQRMDSHAQWEIQQYAGVIGSIVRAWMPLTWEAFEDYRLNACRVSAMEKRVIIARLAGNVISFEDSGMSKREWAALNERWSS